MVTRHLFLGLLSLLALQRCIELRLSHRNERWMLDNGGVEYASRQYIFMKFVHFTWFLAMIVEVYAMNRTFLPKLASFALLFTVAGQTLRYAAIRALGRRWTVRIFTIPNTPAVTKGIYHYIRHPNYAGVILELLAVPLIHSATITSIVWSMVNAFILAFRIRCEEQALIENSSGLDYPLDRPRFIPDLSIR